jgi:hypothetical protein
MGRNPRRAPARPIMRKSGAPNQMQRSPVTRNRGMPRRPAQGGGIPLGAIQKYAAAITEPKGRMLAQPTIRGEPHSAIERRGKGHAEASGEIKGHAERQEALALRFLSKREQLSKNAMPALFRKHGVNPNETYNPSAGMQNKIPNETLQKINVLWNLAKNPKGDLNYLNSRLRSMGIIVDTKKGIITVDGTQLGLGQVFTPKQAGFVIESFRLTGAIQVNGTKEIRKILYPPRNIIK